MEIVIGRKTPISEETRIRVDQIQKNRLMALRLQRGMEEASESLSANGWNCALRRLADEMERELLKLCP